MVRVLLVEDEIRLAETVRRGLGLEGFVVDVAHTGPEGLRRAVEGGFDVVVLDIMLPGVSGYEVLRRLRSHGVDTPVLMLTAKDGDHEEADALDLGADDYLTKPFSFVVLIAHLRALLRRAPHPGEVLVAGDLTLDVPRRRVLRGTTPVSLTPREFSLLECLMRNKGAVVTKTMLLSEVSGRALARPTQCRRGLHRLPSSQDRRPVRNREHRNAPRRRLPPGRRLNPGLLGGLSVLSAAAGQTARTALRPRHRFPPISVEGSPLMSASGRTRSSRLTRRGLLRVPEIGAMFWIVKALSTAMGESSSDYLVNAMVPQVAVLLGFVAFAAALVVQLRASRYTPGPTGWRW